MSKAFSAAIWVALLVALGCAGVRRGEVETPEVRLANLVPLDATLFEQRVRVDLRIVNPNDFALKLDGIRFALEINDEMLARGVSDADATVPRLGDAVVSVETTTTSTALIRQVLGAKGRPALDYRLSGDLLLKRRPRRTVAFERSGSVPLQSGGSASP